MKLNLNELRKVLKLNDTATVEDCYVEIGRLQSICEKTPAPWIEYRPQSQKLEYCRLCGKLIQPTNSLQGVQYFCSECVRFIPDKPF